MKIQVFRAHDAQPPLEPHDTFGLRVGKRGKLPGCKCRHCLGLPPRRADDRRPAFESSVQAFLASRRRA